MWQKKNLFIESIEGIGDILVYETRRYKNKLVKAGLENLVQLMFKNFEKKIQKTKSQNDDLLKNKHKLEENRLPKIEPDKYEISYSTIINQVIRIYEASIESKNDEISRWAIYKVKLVLQELVSTPGNEYFIRSILYVILSEINKMAININNIKLYLPGVTWYGDIVFQPDQNRKFDLSYIEIFDKYLFETFKNIISNDNYFFYKELVSSLFNNISIENLCMPGEIYKYTRLMLDHNYKKYCEVEEKFSIEEKIRRLEDLHNKTKLKEELNMFMQKFDELKKIVYPNLADEQKEEADKVEQEVKLTIEKKVKRYHLVQVLFGASAFCLFEQKFDYIKYLWEYKQPPDSDSFWFGNDLVPRTLEEIFNLYLATDLFEKRFDFHKDHHGSGLYYIRYFLLLLIRSLKDLKPNENGKYDLIESFKLPDVNKLTELYFSLDDLIKHSENLKEENSCFVSLLQLDPEQIKNNIDLKLIPLLKKIKEEIKLKISIKHRTGKINISKIEKFKETVIKEFKRTATMRQILKSFNKEIKITNSVNYDLERIGISTIEDKAIFFENWHFNYIGVPENLGRELALLDNTKIINMLSKSCKDIKINNLDDVCSKFKNISDLIILTNNIFNFQKVFNPNNFIPKWRSSKINWLENKAFEGYIIFNEHEIPIFAIENQIKNYILVLNKNSIGQFNQLSPLNMTDDKNLMKDIFYFNIQAFSDGNDLINKTLKENPEWLMKFREEIRREELEKLVLIEIYERLEHIFNDFEGYQLFMNEY